MKQRAFTLIELLVVVAIIGILAAVGVVAYNKYTLFAKRSATLANWKSASKFIGAKFALCDIEGGTVKLSNTRSINCNIINTRAGVNQMADIFKDHFLDIGYTNPYDSTADAVVRRGGGGNVLGGIRFDETECPGGKPAGRSQLVIWTQIDDKNYGWNGGNNTIFQMSHWCQ